jgi:Tat protein translocase TatB subunit
MSIYFLFLESLGTPEMVMILLVALIVFGPRKLPTIGKTIGKYTAEFKRATGDFKQTWERELREVELAESPNSKTENLAELENQAAKTDYVENTIGRTSLRQTAASDLEDFTALNESDSLALPEIRAVSREDFDAFKNESAAVVETAEATPTSKRDWL